MREFVDTDALEKVFLKPGMTVDEALAVALPVHLREQESLVVFSRGNAIPRSEWSSVRLVESERLLVGIMPQGGGSGRSKGAITVILGVLMIVAAFATAGWSLAGLSAGMGGMAGNVAIMGAGLVLSGIAAMMIKPPPQPNEKEGGGVSPITGQSNQMRPYAAVMKVYGRHKVFPPIATQPQINNYGESSTMGVLYDFGLGFVAIEDIKIGDVDAAEYAPTFNLQTNTKAPAIYWTGKVGYDTFAYELGGAGASFLMTTKPSTTYAEVSVAFPVGLYSNDNKMRDLENWQVEFVARYRKAGTTEWSYLLPWNVAGMPAGFGKPPVVGWTPISVTNDPRSSRSVRYDWESQSNRSFWWVGSLSAYGKTWTAGEFDTSVFVGDIELGFPGLPNTGASRGYAVYRNITLTKGAFDVNTGETRISWSGEKADLGAPPIVISGKFTRPQVAAFLFSFPEAAEWEVEIIRNSQMFNRDTDRYFDRTIVTALRSSVPGPLLRPRCNHTFLEMYLVATEKVQGVVQNLSAVATSVLDIYDAAGNLIGKAATRNPAWIALDILMGDCNCHALRSDMIDWPSWVHLANYCDTPRTWNINGKQVTSPRFCVDFVVDSFVTVKTLIESVLSSCRASLMITQEGKWGVLIDEEKTIPRQVLTPANTWNFSGQRTFPAETHGLRVRFTDAAANYQQQEVVVYVDGYDSTTATELEEYTVFGLTEWYRAWAEGRYRLACGIHRSEVFSVQMSIEHLAVQRGDLVHLSHDVPKVGGQPTRITEINGNTIRIPQELSSAPTSYTVRLQTGQVRQGTVVAAVSGTEFTLDSTAGVNADDLIVLGIADRVTFPYMIQSITPQEDFNALITLVPYVRAVYDADIGALPPWNPNYGDNLINATNLAVVTVVAEQFDITYVNREPNARLRIAWTVNSPFYDSADVVRIINGVRETIATVNGGGLVYTYDINLLTAPEAFANSLAYEVIPYTAAGLRGASKLATLIVDTDTDPPIITSFAANVQDMQVSMFWEAANAPDIDRFELRYSPSVIGASWGAAQAIGTFPWNVTRTTVGARTGTYFLQATDTSGNKSPVVYRRTTVEELPEINVVDTVNDRLTGWTGAKANTQLVGGHVELSGNWGDVVPEGHYYYSGFVDLTDIYEVRVSSKIQAHGSHRNEVMSSPAWMPMANKRPLAGDVADEWSARLEYRSADVAVVMAEWVPNIAAAVADPIAGPGQSHWSEWRPIEVGDVTARLLQFRIRMQSFSPDVRAIVTDGLIEIDAMDRTWKQYDIAVPIAGTRVLFQPPFMSTPVVAVTIDGNIHAVGYELSDRDRKGINIKLVDSSNNPVAGQVDILALGQGLERLQSI